MPLVAANATLTPRASGGAFLPVGGAAARREQPNAAYTASSDLASTQEASKDANTAIANMRAYQGKYGFTNCADGYVGELVRMVHSAVDASVPPTTRRTDASHWRFWTTFCDVILGTSLIRDNHAANNGTDRAGYEHEVLLQNMFLVWRYATMVPRRRRDPAANPESASKSLLAVRRAHKRRGITMAAAPTSALVIKGLLNEYVRLHGPESLMPHRKDPLTNEMMYDIADSVSHTPDGITVGRVVVSWTCRAFLVFWALLCTLRHAGARKADLLPVIASEFCGRDPARSNFQFIIGGQLYADPSPELLRSVKPGDSVRVRPPPSKADPWALTFGNALIYLPYVDDITNAARAIVNMELAAPCRGAARHAEPAFSVEDGVSLDHGLADNVFDKNTTAALGAEVAATVSLHSGRVWLACALLAKRKCDGTIQAMQRWKSVESIKVYAKMQPEEYIAHLLDAIDAKVTAQMRDSIPPSDIDDGMLRLQRRHRSSMNKDQARQGAAAQAAPPCTPTRAAPARASATPTAARCGGQAIDFERDSDGDEDEDNDVDEPEETGDVVQVNDEAPLEISSVSIGMHVGVCFHNAAGIPTYYGGHVTKLMQATARIKFREFEDTYLDYDVSYNRIFSIAPHSRLS